MTSLLFSLLDDVSVLSQRLSIFIIPGPEMLACVVLRALPTAVTVLDCLPAMMLLGHCAFAFPAIDA